MNPSEILRSIAKLVTRLAAAFEDQHNRQNNNWGGALGNAELGLENRIDALRGELIERITHLEAGMQRLTQVIEAQQRENGHVGT